MAVVRRRLLVSGRVQGVFYRASVEREAARHHVGGFARNLRDGRVELAFEGEQADVEAMVSWARLGPPRATVTGVEIHVEEPSGERTFRAG